MATTYISRTPGSAGDRKTWTFSVWVKRAAGSLTSNQTIIHGGPANPTATLRFSSESASDSKLNFYVYSGSFTTQIVTNAEYRDPSAWYHIVLAADTTQTTAADRVKLYVNGTQVTSFMTETYPAEDFEFSINNNTNQNIGGATGGGDYFDGLMSFVSFCDGTALAPTVFGQTDSDTGEWTINISPSFTLGTNGFKILENGNTITDQSSNSNDFTLSGGTLTNTEDCPDDVFSTMNPLNVPTSNAPTFSHGNTTTKTSEGSGTTDFGGSSTLGITKGKFYIEAKAQLDETYSRNNIGISGEVSELARGNLAPTWGSASSSYCYNSEDGNKYVNGSSSSYGNTYTTGDIIGIAIDITNSNLYFSKNGTWQNSGDPESGATGTGAISIVSTSSTTDGAYFITHGDSSGATNTFAEFSYNFGNGYFGTTIISSEGTNASNIGIFEYDVPTGYTALSTKGLNN